MPLALDRLTRISNIRPVDLAQAAIGPGMEVYSRYSKVMRISGEIVPIREVLMHINNEITAYHEKETGDIGSRESILFDMAEAARLHGRQFRRRSSISNREGYRNDRYARKSPHRRTG